MPTSPSSPPLASALRQTGVTALLAFALLAPLIGFETVQNIRNELVLETRWPLLFVLVAIVAGLRFLQLFVIAPRLADPARRGSRVEIPDALRTAYLRWSMPVAIGFVIVYPMLALLIAGSGAGKFIDNFGIQILIYVLLGWGLNIVVGLAGL